MISITFLGITITIRDQLQIISALNIQSTNIKCNINLQIRELIQDGPHGFSNFVYLSLQVHNGS